jgi:tetratricopeptide (TPR) repeat protein
LSIYEKALEIEPNDYMTNFYIGILYYKAKSQDGGNILKALDFLLKAEQADANTAVLFNIAVVYDELGNFKDSEKYYLKIIDVNKANNNEIIADAILEQNLKVYNNLAILSKKQGKFDDTIGYYKEGLKIDIKNFAFLYNLGLIFLNKSKYKQAIKLLNKAILCKSLISENKI